MLVAIVGPDGCGKSTLAERLACEARRDFRRVLRFHWRPGTIPRLRKLLGYKGYDPPPTDPHGALPAGLVSSLVRFAYYATDFVIGARLGKFRARNEEESLVIVERYYHDLLVDPTRYRMDVPRGVVEAIMPLVPAPDLVVLLDGEATEFYRRKPELPLEEIERQLREHRLAVHEWGTRVMVLDTTTASNDTAARLASEVRRLKGRPVWDPDGRVEDVGVLLGGRFGVRVEVGPAQGSAEREYVLVPDRTLRTRFVLPGVWADVAMKALYHPYTARGKGAVALVGRCARSRLLRALPLRRLVVDPRGPLGFAYWLRRRAGVEGAKEFGFCTGARGAEGKVSGVALDPHGQVLAFFKAARSQVAQQGLQNEVTQLTRLKSVQMAGIRLPRVVGTGMYRGLLVEVLLPVGVRPMAPAGWELPSPVLGLLDALRGRFGGKTGWRETTTRRKAVQVAEGLVGRRKRLAEGALQWLDKRLETVQTTFAHGDLAPWNVLLGNGEAAVLDWERAGPNELSGMDLCHFYLAPRSMAGVEPERLVSGCLTFLGRYKDFLGADAEAVLRAYLIRYPALAAMQGIENLWTAGCFEMLDALLA